MKKVYCPSCGQSNDPHNTLCGSCGRKVYQMPVNRDFYCPSCGARITASSTTCYHCDFDFSKLSLLAPGQGKKFIPQETVDTSSKSIFMQKGIYVVIGFALVIFWIISFFMPWYNPAGTAYNLLGFGQIAGKFEPKNFWIVLITIWAYLPFAAAILAIISLIRKRIHSIVTYCSFAIPWIIGFVVLNIFLKWTPYNCQYILQTGEICFIISIILFFLFDRLLYALKITKN